MPFHEPLCGERFSAWLSVVQEIVKELVLDSDSEHCSLHWLGDSWSILDELLSSRNIYLEIDS